MRLEAAFAEKCFKDVSVGLILRDLRVRQNESGGGVGSPFTGNLAYSVWRGAQGEEEVEDQSRGQKKRK